MKTPVVKINTVKVTMVIVLVMALLSCAPRATTSPAPVITPAPAVTPTSNLPPPTSQDVALQKLIEGTKKEGTVTLYSFNFMGDVGLAMSQAFKARYGINVDIITGRGAEFTERLKTEARMGARTGDFTEGSPVNVINIKNAGLTAPSKDLPVLQEKDVWKVNPASMDPDGHLLVSYPSFMQPLSNTKLLKPEDEPKSWAELLQPKWKGKVMVTDPVVSTNTYATFQPLIRGGAMTEDYIKKLGAQDLVYVNGSAQGVERLIRGEYPIFAGVQAINASDAAREGAPVKALDFTDGMAGLTIVHTIIKDAPHMNAAKLFANWYLSKEGQQTYSKAKGAPTIRKDVQANVPPSLDVYPVKPIFPTADDLILQGKMFADKVWVLFFKK